MKGAGQSQGGTKAGFLGNLVYNICSSTSLRQRDAGTRCERGGATFIEPPRGRGLLHVHRRRSDPGGSHGPGETLAESRMRLMEG